MKYLLHPAPFIAKFCNEKNWIVRSSKFSSDSFIIDFTFYFIFSSVCSFWPLHFVIVGSSRFCLAHTAMNGPDWHCDNVENREATRTMAAVRFERAANRRFDATIRSSTSAQCSKYNAIKVHIVHMWTRFRRCRAVQFVRMCVCVCVRPWAIPHVQNIEYDNIFQRHDPNGSRDAVMKYSDRRCLIKTTDIAWFICDFGSERKSR